MYISVSTYMYMYIHTNSYDIYIAPLCHPICSSFCLLYPWQLREGERERERERERARARERDPICCAAWSPLSLAAAREGAGGRAGGREGGREGERETRSVTRLGLLNPWRPPSTLRHRAALACCFYRIHPCTHTHTHTHTHREREREREREIRF